MKGKSNNINNNWKWSIYISKQKIMKRVTETFIRLFCNKKREEATHYDNHIVGNTAIIIMNQWKHFIDRFWKQYQLDYYLDWLNRRITRYVKANLYQECIPMSNNPKIWIYVWIDSGEHKTENKDHLVFALLCMERLIVVTQHQFDGFEMVCIVSSDCW